MADIPEGIVLRRHRDLEGRKHDVWLRRTLLALVGIVPLLALLNVFGQRSETSRAQSSFATLSVDAPSKLRGGLLFQARFRVVARQELKNAILVLDRGWSDGITINTIEPTPVNQASKNDKLEFTLGHIGLGHSYLLNMDFQVNPTYVGRRSAGVALWDGNSRLLRVSRNVTVFP